MSVNDRENSFDKQSVSDFMKLVFENERRIYAYIYVLVPSQVEADDIFQDTVTIMWEKYETFIPDQDFGSWGIGIAYNVVRNYRRKKARSRLQFTDDIERLLESETKKVLPDLDRKLDALKQCLVKLNPADKRVLKLKYEYECSTREIAERIGYSRKTVYVKIARANDLLLGCVKRLLAGQNA